MSASDSSHESGDEDVEPYPPRQVVHDISSGEESAERAQSPGNRSLASANESLIRGIAAAGKSGE
jgi:hypothetical protein